MGDLVAISRRSDQDITVGGLLLNRQQVPGTSKGTANFMKGRCIGFQGLLG